MSSSSVSASRVAFGRKFFRISLPWNSRIYSSQINKLVFVCWQNALERFTNKRELEICFQHLLLLAGIKCMQSQLLSNLVKSIQHYPPLPGSRFRCYTVQYFERRNHCQVKRVWHGIVPSLLTKRLNQLSAFLLSELSLSVVNIWFLWRRNELSSLIVSAATNGKILQIWSVTFVMK